MRTPIPMIRVFLVDEHEIVRRGITSVLESQGDITIVGQSQTMTDALPAILRLRPDVVVLDAQLPDGTGVDVCREMRAADPEIKALILTSHDDDDAVSAAILAGVSGYLLKQIEASALVNGVRLVAGGHSLIDPAVTSRVMRQVEVNQWSLQLVSDLTPQQTKIFHLIGEGLTNRQIAERTFLAEKTVKNHVTGLLRRLRLEHRTQVALLANKVRSGGRIPVSRPPQTPLGEATVDIQIDRDAV